MCPLDSAVMTGFFFLYMQWCCKKNHEGLRLTFTSNKSVPSFNKGPNFPSAYPIGNEKMFLQRLGLGFSGLSSGSLRNFANLDPNKRRRPTIITYTFIASLLI